MSLVVEDGTGLTNSDSYVSVAGLRAFAARRGSTLPVTDGACEILIINSMDYLEGMRFIGYKKTATQALSWPRLDAYDTNGYLIASTTIPQNLINALCQLAIIAQTIELQPSLALGAKGGIASESVYGAVSRTYFQSFIGSSKPWIPSVKNFLFGLVVSSFGSTFSIRA